MSENQPLGLDCDICMEADDGWSGSDMDFIGFEVYSNEAIYKCPRCERIEAADESLKGE